MYINNRVVKNRNRIEKADRIWLIIKKVLGTDNKFLWIGNLFLSFKTSFNLT